MTPTDTDDALTPSPIDDTATRPAPVPETPATDAPVAVHKRDANFWMAVGAVPLIVVILVVVAFVGGMGPFATTPTTWSAVFLTDNEVFFGHIKSTTPDNIDLVNVYYVQSSQGTGTGATAQSTQLAVLGLVGTQIQCPTDELIVNRTAVLDVQKLQPQSFVVSRLETLSKTAQNCFQPAAATATPAAPATSPTPAAATSSP
jgi:hypothetical protein